MSERTYRWIAIAVVSAALGLRLIGLSKGMHIDEWDSIQITQAGGFFEMLDNLRHYDHPPLYFVLLHLWLQVNNSEVFLRLLSVMMGTATVLVAVLWMKQHSHIASILLGLLLATAPMLLRFSQEIRDYPLLMLAVSLAFYFASRAVKKPDRSSSYLGLGLSLTLTVSAHLIGIWIVIAVGIFMFSFPEWRKTIPWRRFVPAMFAPVAVFLFFYLFFLLDVDKSKDWWVPPISQWMISHTAQSLFGLPTLPFPWNASKVIFLAIFALCVVAFVLGHWRQGIPFLFAAFAVWLQIIGYSLLGTSLFYDRFLLPSLLPLMAFIAFQTATINPSLVKRIAISVLVVMSAAFAFGWVTQKAWDPVEPWKQMSQLLESECRGNALIIFYPHYTAGPVKYYFTHLQSTPTLQVAPHTSSEELAEALISKIGSAKNGTRNADIKSVYLIVRYDATTSKDRATLQQLLTILKKQQKKESGLTMLSFSSEFSSENLFITVASVLGSPTHTQSLGSFTISRYEPTSMPLPVELPP